MKVYLKSTLLITCLITNTVFAGDDFTTWQEMRFSNVVKQKYDFSCGVAAITTLFNYQFGRNADEQKVLVDYIKSQPKKHQKEITDEGLTLLDLKNIGERSDFNTFVVTIPFAGLVKSERPALVYIEDVNYKHFVVFKGINNGKVFLSDPSQGNRKILIDQFLRIWKGKTALFIDSSKERLLKNLNLKEIDLSYIEYETAQSILNNRF